MKLLLDTNIFLEVILRGKHEVFRQFLRDMILGVGVAVIALSA